MAAISRDSIDLDATPVTEISLLLQNDREDNDCQQGVRAV